MSEGYLILAAGALLAAAVGASLIAVRLRVPALLLFIAVGMAVGSDGAGWVRFDNATVARDVGYVALTLILFDGGLSSGLRSVVGVLAPALRLAIGATIIVAVVTGVAASLLLGLTTLHGLLLGSMLAATDSAAVFGLLRGSMLRKRLVHTMEVEAALNDAVAFVLVVGLIAWVQHPGRGFLELALLMTRELVFGAVVGVAVGRLTAMAISRLRLPSPSLYPVASLAVAALAFGAADAVHGSGFLAVYLAALMLADAELPGRQTMAIFHGGLAWVAQVALFVMLGLLVSPASLGAAVPAGVALALVVMGIARPLATAAVTTAADFSTRERAVLSWAELLGATPLLFATTAVAAGVAGSAQLFDIVFVAVFVSTFVQGQTFELLARILGVAFARPLLPRPLVEFGAARALGAEIVEFPVSATDGAVGRQLGELRVPRGMAVVLIVRGSEAVPPTQSVRLYAGDVLHVLVREEVSARVPELLARLRAWRPVTRTPQRERVR